MPLASTAITQVVRAGAGCRASGSAQTARRSTGGRGSNRSSRGLRGVATAIQMRPSLPVDRLSGKPGRLSIRMSCRPASGPVKHHPADPVRAGLRHRDERLVGGERDPVRELQAVQDDLHRTVGVAAEQPARAGVFHDVGPPVGEVVPLGRVAEPDRAVARDSGVVAEPETVGEHVDRAGARRDPEKAPISVADHQVTVAVDLDAERTPARVGDHRRRAAVEVEPQDPAVGHAGVEVAVGVDHHVFRARRADRPECRRRHRRIAGREARAGCRDGWLPDDRVDPGTALHGPHTNPHRSSQNPPRRLVKTGTTIGGCRVSPTALPRRRGGAACAEAGRVRPDHHAAHPPARPGARGRQRACAAPRRGSAPGWSRSATSTCSSPATQGGSGAAHGQPGRGHRPVRQAVPRRLPALHGGQRDRGDRRAAHRRSSTSRRCGCSSSPSARCGRWPPASTPAPWCSTRTCCGRWPSPAGRRR